MSSRLGAVLPQILRVFGGQGGGDLSRQVAFVSPGAGQTHHPRERSAQTNDDAARSGGAALVVPQDSAAGAELGQVQNWVRKNVPFALAPFALAPLLSPLCSRLKLHVHAP